MLAVQDRRSESGTSAAGHEDKRARLAAYNVHPVISEYRIQRWAIVDVLKANGVQLTDKDVFLVNASAVNPCMIMASA